MKKMMSKWELKIGLCHIGEGCHRCGTHAKFANSGKPADVIQCVDETPLAAYDIGAGASGTKTNKQTLKT